MNVKAMPPLPVVPQPKLRRLIDAGGLADSTMCWTCSSCDSECPVEIATNRLRPQRIVRFANLGLIDELIALPEIWYCLTCRRCNRVCPNLVKPETLIRYARAEAVRRGVVPLATATAYYDLFRRFQRVRWHVASAVCMGMSSPRPTPIGSAGCGPRSRMRPRPCPSQISSNAASLSGRPPGRPGFPIVSPAASAAAPARFPASAAPSTPGSSSA